jgi:hypothetical protein
MAQGRGSLASANALDLGKAWLQGNEAAATTIRQSAAFKPVYGCVRKDAESGWQCHHDTLLLLITLVKVWCPNHDETFHYCLTMHGY